MQSVNQSSSFSCLKLLSCVKLDIETLEMSFIIGHFGNLSDQAKLHFGEPRIKRSIYHQSTIFLNRIVLIYIKELYFLRLIKE